MNTQTTCLTFAVEASAEAPQRFRGVAYSGGLIPSYGFYGDAAIDLDSIKLPEGKLFALVDHDHAKRAGQFTARLEANQIIVEGSLFTATDAGREVAALMAEGAPWQMSVGIQAKAEEINGAAEINGQTLAINTLFKDAHLREVSFVPVGADPNTTVAAFSRNLAATVADEVPQPEVTDMSEELQTQIDELSAQLEAERTARVAAESALAEIKAQARTESLAQLSAELGREFSEVETQTFAALDDAAFGVMAGALKSLKPAAPEHLFREQATDGKQDNAQTALIQARASLIKQVSGKE